MAVQHPSHPPSTNLGLQEQRQVGTCSHSEPQQQSIQCRYIPHIPHTPTFRYSHINYTHKHITHTFSHTNSCPHTHSHAYPHVHRDATHSCSHNHISTHTHLALPPGLQDTGQPSGPQEVAPGQAQDTGLTCSESWGNTASKANILGAAATDARRGPGGPAAGSYRVTCFLLGSTCRKGVASAACTGQIRNRTFTCGSVELVSMGPGISARWGKARVQEYRDMGGAQRHRGAQNMGGTWRHGQRVMEDTAGTWGHREIGGVGKGAERPGAGRTGQAESVWPVEEKRCLWPPHVQVP